MRLWIRYSVSDLLMTEARPISTTDRIAAQKKGMWLISAPTTDVTSDVRKGDRNLRNVPSVCPGPGRRLPLPLPSEVTVKEWRTAYSS